ncbi:DUF1189 domain-containing protein (plasmid) [Bacillus sp. 31A1R]|uniref:DUF1189 domain-containing protein n=1 Tax=Robertmurraya mangrovi TaxID=3098077 RepID=A0ABU5IV00_9BACI|nr:DUF1189 domain-containing protein [Bacillus sp. 31A1R]MDZ5470976.1 DUF1189 domain-containing protein [Bacillus sp. 31A1R]
MNIFKQFTKSLYSPKDIALFRFQGIGKTILYVFLLTLLSVIPTVTYFSMTMVNGLEAAQSTINDEIPSFVIENGSLSSEQTEPVEIHENDFSIIFDSTGKIQQDDLKTVDNGIALLQKDFIVVTGGTLDAYSYSMFTDLVITKDDFIKFLDTLDSLLAIIIPIFIIVIYIFSSGIKFIEVSILAAIGLVLRSMTQRNLQYRQLWRMAAYSVTLPTIFFTIMEAIQTGVPNGFLLNWFVSILVLFLAIREIPKPKNK